MPDTRPDARFKHETLYVFKPGEVQLIKAWPDLTSVRKRDSGTRWLPFAPDYPLIRPYRPKRNPRTAPAEPLQLALPLADGPDDGACTPKPQQSTAERRRRAFHGFRFACPKPVARRVEPFRGDHLELLRLLLALGSADDLLDSNPTSPPPIPTTDLNEATPRGGLGVSDRRPARRVIKSRWLSR